MSRLSFFIKRLVRIDRKRFKETFAAIKKRSGKSTPWLIIDMLISSLRYGAGYMDYSIAEMYRLNHRQKSTTITRGISNDIVRRMNDKSYTHFFDDKAEFNAHFSKWVNRKWLHFDETITRESFNDFIKGCSSIFVKPIEGSSGIGVKRIDDLSDTGSLYDSIKALGDSILEETVVQHSEMARLCPYSVNTVRIATLIGDKKSGIVYTFLRIGNGKAVDNVDCGGMACRIDTDTGIITTPAANKAGEVFYKHPLTGSEFIGFNIPYFEEAKQICLEAMNIVPEVRFVAWDVAITKDGAYFIEGNSFPSHAVPQFAAHYPDGMGILTEFRKFLDC
ncbi:MAG: sugar-transfer associated ATP-grasp domain-containing protein [Christensenellales bacterium]|jgi:hypothetical protein